MDKVSTTTLLLTILDGQKPRFVHCLATFAVTVITILRLRPSISSAIRSMLDRVIALEDSLLLSPTINLARQFN
jgi:hypothetical protein